MKVIRSVVTVLRDKNDLPILSMVGDLDFCIRSYQQTLLQSSLDEDIMEICKSGSVQVVCANVSALDDNNVKLNQCCYAPCNYNIPTSAVLSYTDFSDKSFKKASVVCLKNLAQLYERLEKEVKKEYENGKNDEIKRINASK